MDDKSRTTAHTAHIVPSGDEDYAIVLPDEILRHLGLVLGSDIIMEIREGSITIRKAPTDV